MGKIFLAAVIAFGLLIAADQYYNYGLYTDIALAMLHQLRHSFGV